MDVSEYRSYHAIDFQITLRDLVIVQLEFVYTRKAGPLTFFTQGLKGTISTASLEMISEQKLNEGEGGRLVLGYGFYG